MTLKQFIKNPKCILTFTILSSISVIMKTSSAIFSKKMVVVLHNYSRGKLVDPLSENKGQYIEVSFDTVEVI